MGTPQYMSPEQALGQEHARSTRAPTCSRSARSSTRCSAGSPRSPAGRWPRWCTGWCTSNRRRSATLAPALPENVLAASTARSRRTRRRPQDSARSSCELTGRPLHSFHTGQPRSVDPAVGVAGSHPHPATPTGPTASWPKTRASSASRSAPRGHRSPPRPMPGAERSCLPRAGALLGVALGGWCVLGLAEDARAADAGEPRPARAAQASDPRPPPPATRLRSSPSSAQTRRGAAPAEPAQRARRRPRAGEAAPRPAAPRRAPGGEPEPRRWPRPSRRRRWSPTRPAGTRPTASSPRRASCWTRPRTRSAKNKPLDAARLVDQSFYIQKTALGYAIQARAACQRHDIGGARAAFRNVTEPQLKQIVLRTCVRQGVWLF